jgi:hypothetical protein
MRLTKRESPERAVSQNSTAWNIEVDVRSRRARAPDEDPGVKPTGSTSTGRTPTEVRASAFPRKEVIQPHLPVRLPCYDFTPIIDPTFDGCLPEGLAHRLRVLPTFVV